MHVKTTRFGTLKIDKDKIIDFPAGIPGFENLKHFFMLPVEGNENIQWLQAADEPSVALLVIDPFPYFNGYAVKIPKPVLEDLKIKEPAQALVLAAITIPGGKLAAATANLLAPIIINTSINRAKQVILSASSYSTRHLLFPPHKPQQAEKVSRASGKEGV